MSPIMSARYRRHCDQVTFGFGGSYMPVAEWKLISLTIYWRQSTNLFHCASYRRLFLT